MSEKEIEAVQESPESRSQEEKNLEVAMKALSKKYKNDLSLFSLGDTQIKEYEVVPTGLLSFDIATGIMGLPLGKIIEIWGQESSCKTSFGLYLAGEFQKQISNKKVALIDLENSFDPKWAKTLGANPNQLLISQPSSMEQALDILLAIARSGAVSLVMLDSVAGLVPQSELEGDIGDNTIGIQARKMSQCLRMLSPALQRTNTTALFTNQVRSKIGVSYGSPEVTSGGAALRFWAHMRLRSRVESKIKSGDEIVGVWQELTFRKNKLAPPFKVCRIPLLYSEGYRKKLAMLEPAVSMGVINKAGSWYSFGEDRLGQGAEKAADALTDEVATEVYRKVKEQLNG